MTNIQKKIFFLVKNDQYQKKNFFFWLLPHKMQHFLYILDEAKEAIARMIKINEKILQMLIYYRFNQNGQCQYFLFSYFTKVYKAVQCNT